MGTNCIFLQNTHTRLGTNCGWVPTVSTLTPPCSVSYFIIFCIGKICFILISEELKYEKALNLNPLRDAKLISHERIQTIHFIYFTSLPCSIGGYKKRNKTIDLKWHIHLTFEKTKLRSHRDKKISRKSLTAFTSRNEKNIKFPIGFFHVVNEFVNLISV